MARTKQSSQTKREKKGNANNTPLGESRYPQEQPNPALSSKQQSVGELMKDEERPLNEPVEPQLDGPTEAPKQQQLKKRKKKNAPDRPQPEWMFPPDESNLILNPKQKPAEELIKDKDEWDAAVKFLKYRAHTAPVKTAPPKQLLTLVGAFLTAYGFNNTVRIYQLQCSSREKLDGWDSALGEMLPKDFPDLVKIYKEWSKTYKEKQKMDETSSSDTDDSLATKKRKTVSKDRKAKEAAKVKPEQTSSSGSSAGRSEDSSSDSSSGSESDIGMKHTPIPTKPASKLKQTKDSESSSSATSSFDSDADDENDTAGLGAPLRKPTVNGLIKKPKRKDSPSASSSSASSSSEDVPVSKKAKKADTKPKTAIEAPEPVSKNSSPKLQTSPKSSSETDSPSAEISAVSGISSSKLEKYIEEEDKPTFTGSKDSTLTPIKVSVSSSSDSSSSSSDSSDDNDFAVPKLEKPLPDSSKPSSDSSVTLVPTPAIGTPSQSRVATHSSLSSSSSDSSSDSDSSITKPVLTTTVTKITKRKRSTSPITETTTTVATATEDPPSKKQQKPKNQSFSRIPPTVTVDPRLASNKYQPYDYAERAHQDLSVTKGKGFTKEKNKKKRGSYRGGAIDLNGGRGVKFED